MKGTMTGAHGVMEVTPRLDRLGLRWDKMAKSLSDVT